MAALHWEIVGQGERYLVLLHGWGLNADVWRGISDQHSTHFCLYLPDLPGYGRSEGFGR